MDKTKELLAGNRRFMAKADKKALKKHARSQKPKIAILACSDSRVIPEFIFDKGIGEIFVVRVAGNVATDQTVLESLEYAVRHLGVELILVMGHTGCGAVVECEKNPESDKRLLQEIRASFPLCQDHVISNLKRQVNSLPERSKIISEALTDEELVIMGALYDLESGEVKFFEE